MCQSFIEARERLAFSQVEQVEYLKAQFASLKCKRQ